MEAKVFPIAPVSSSAATGLLFAVLLVILLVFFMVGYVFYSMKNCRFEVNNQGLQVRGDMYSRLIPYKSIKMDGIKMLDLSCGRDSEYQPSFRTNGAALPGYLSGWYRLKNKEKALLFVSDKTKVIYIPTGEGFSVLLSPDEPQAFLDALKASASR
ncbi:MAG: PH domain-containing protein [Firmicutes bacterium]|nr:PH domain-containing protein [Bacillota bacterium]